MSDKRFPLEEEANEDIRFTSDDERASRAHACYFEPVDQVTHEKKKQDKHHHVKHHNHEELGHRRHDGHGTKGRPATPNVMKFEDETEMPSVTHALDTSEVNIASATRLGQEDDVSDENSMGAVGNFASARGDGNKEPVANVGAIAVGGESGATSFRLPPQYSGLGQAQEDSFHEHNAPPVLPPSSPPSTQELNPIEATLVDDNAHDVEAQVQDRVRHIMSGIITVEAHAEGPPALPTDTDSGQRCACRKTQLLIALSVLLVVISGVVVGIVVGGRKTKQPLPMPDPVLDDFSQECLEEFSSLNNRTSILDVKAKVAEYDEERWENCAANEDCRFNYAPFTDMYKDACHQEGGQFVTFSFVVDCTRTIYYDFNPWCIGASCDAEKFVSRIVSNMEENYEESEKVDCTAKLHSEGGSEDVTALGGLSQQCVDELGAIYTEAAISDAEKAAYAIAQTQSLSCQTNQTCPIDYASVEKSYRTACDEVGGRFMTMNYTASCTEFQIQFSNVPFCLGLSCDITAVQEAWAVAVKVAFESGEDPWTNCVIQ